MRDQLKIRQNCIVGIDIGSVAVKTVLVRDEQIVASRYSRLNASVSASLLEALEWAESEVENKSFQYAITGRGCTQAARELGINPVNELFAQAAGAVALCPQAGSVIDIGGHDAAFLLLDRNRGKVTIRDFSLNSRCAAGTGSFLDQQAARLGVSIEDEFQKLALSAENTPRIAGRCSVFAKSDMIHLQQIATPDREILAGLCRAMAESFKSDIIRDRIPILPIAFVGGVSRNRAMEKHFREVLKLQREEDLLVHPRAAFSGALGAALRAQEDGKLTTFSGIPALREAFAAGKNSRKKDGLEPLVEPLGSYAAATGTETADNSEAFLGIDIGSISTNLVLMDIQGRIIAKRYLITAGRPIEAVKQGLASLRSEFGTGLRVIGCGTTGSGRYLIGDLFGADLVKNEITAQARGALFLVPDADTIFEIGGQDSKYISLSNGVVRDFTMNKACAAGTGSFLEEQAGLLGISVKDDFSKLAFAAENPAPLGQRCTVFIESDLVKRQGEGESRENLCAGLAYSVVNNYLNRVVEHRPVGNRVLFQGGTAFNRAVTAAFGRVTGKGITVPPHNEVTGALGMAVMVREKYLEKSFTTSCPGFDSSMIRYTIETFTCNACANACEIRKVSPEGREEPLFYGHRCEKYEMKKKNHDAEHLDFSTVRAGVFKKHATPKPDNSRNETVGIPLGLSFHETLPYWTGFWESLGFRVLVSPDTNRKLIRQGTAATHAETCFPVKVFHGHVDALRELNPDFIFLPALINMNLDGSESEHNFNCPLSQAVPFLIRSAFGKKLPKMISPSLHMQYGTASLLKELKPALRPLKVSTAEIRRALQLAEARQKAYEEELRECARKFWNQHKEKRKILLVGRPYNLSDRGLNLDIPRKLAELGIPSISLDVLTLLRPDAHDKWRDIYWRYGQQILRLLEQTVEDETLLPVYITNFNCGPDSFLLHYASRIRKGKPILFLELDEHSADAGIVTRLEAFLDSVPETGSLGRKIPEPKSRGRWNFRDKKVFVPNLCDDALAIAAGFRSEGIDSVVLEEPDRDNILLGQKHTSGKECFPMILTTGDLIKLSKRGDHHPGRSVFFMPTTNGPCRFGEYSRLQSLILEESGLQGIEVFSPSSGDGYDQLRELSNRFYYNIWKGMVCIDILFKMRISTRPYEAESGQTDRIYLACLKRIEKNIESGGKGLLREMKSCAAEFKAIQTVEKNLVRIGMVGEIYVRCNRFANSDIVRELERLGAAVMVAPFGEWSFYSNYLSRRNNLDQRKFMAALNDSVKDYIQHRIEHRYASPFQDSGYFREPPVRDVVDKASSFLDPAVRGEALLSIGKAVDFMDRDFSGIVNVMPFSCMPGLLVGSISPSIRRERDEIPWLDLAFEDSGKQLDSTLLEAFIEQAKAYSKRRRSDG